MKPPLFRLAVLLSALALSAAARAADKPAKEDIPAPDWVKMIDQGDRDPRLKGYKTPEGVKVEIAAEDPVVVHPVGMAFADDGTPYVLEERPWVPNDFFLDKAVTFTYKNGATRRWVTTPKSTWDPVKTLNDSKGKGAYDQFKVVFEDELPSGILLYDGWLYVAGQGTVRRYKRGKPDGPFDVKEVVAQGFCGPITRQVRGMTVGADGRLYLSAAAGDNDVEGSDGSRATVLRSGAVFRCRPDGSQMETYAIGSTGPHHGTSFDAAGDSDLLVYNDTRFPDNYRGLIFTPDGDRTVLASKVERRGAAFQVAQQFEFLSSDDPSFHPCQAVLGPDGSVYVVDNRDEKHGRIYRLTWAGTKDQPALPPRGMDSWAKVAALGDDDLVKALQSDEAGDRDHARRELAKRGEKNRPALLKLLKDADQPDAGRVAALGALESMWDDDVRAAVLFVLEHDANADLRRLAADALGLNAARGDGDAHTGLLHALNDAAPEVRRAAALAMSHVAADGAADALVNTWAADDGRDPYLRDGLVRAIENLGKPGVGRLIALGESGVQKETDKTVLAFTMMRTRPAADAIPRLLENPHLSAAERGAVLRSYENYLLDPPLSPAPVVDYLLSHPDEDAAVKRAGVEALAAMDVGPEDARRVGQAFLDKKLPTDVRPQVADILRRCAEKDADCAKLLAAVMKAGE